MKTTNKNDKNNIAGYAIEGMGLYPTQLKATIKPNIKVQAL
jgi:hypothetical protein